MILMAYTRVSTAEQASSGLGMAAQRSAIESWCAAMDHEIMDWFSDDGVSAKTLDRPGLQDAISWIECGHADGLIVFKLDRLTRSVADLNSLMDRFNAQNKALVSVRDNLDTHSATGRMVANIIASIAQWEREIISERTRDALAELRAKGVRLGRPPKYRPADDAFAFVLSQASGMTLREIGRFIGTNGKDLHPQTVKQMIERHRQTLPV